MKSIYTKQINNEKEAKLFIDNLFKEKLLFHPETDAHKVIDAKTNKPLFTKQEADLMNLRLEELFTNLEDPCKYIIEHETYISEYKN